MDGEPHQSSSASASLSACKPAWPGIWFKDSKEWEQAEGSAISGISFPRLAALFFLSKPHLCITANDGVTNMATLLGQPSLHRCCNVSASLRLLRGARILSYHSSSRLLAGGQGHRAHHQTAFLRYPTPARFQSLGGSSTHARTNSCSSNHTPHRKRRVEECRVFLDLYRRSISSTSGPRYPQKVRCEIPTQVFQNTSLLLRLPLPLSQSINPPAMFETRCSALVIYPLDEPCEIGNGQASHVHVRACDF